jgi:hypothetical protein
MDEQQRARLAQTGRDLAAAMRRAGDALKAFSAQWDRSIGEELARRAARRARGIRW